MYSLLLFAGNLHLGNVMLEDGTVKLLDIENFLLGLPSYYRDYFTQFKKIKVHVKKVTHLRLQKSSIITHTSFCIYYLSDYGSRRRVLFWTCPV